MDRSSDPTLRAAAALGMLALLVAACAGTPAPDGGAATATPAADSTPTDTPADMVPTPGTDLATLAPDRPGGAGAGSATVEMDGQTYELVATVCSLDPPGPVLDMVSPDGQVSLNATTGISGVTTLTLETAADGGTWFVSGQQLFAISGSTATFTGVLGDPASGRDEQATITVICGDGS